MNTLSISETKVVLEGITIGGKSMVKHLETINQCKAILFIEDLINNNEKMSEWNLKSIHTLFLKDIDNTNSGKYRNENVLISSAIHIPPKYFELNYLMQKLIAEYQKKWIKYHPVVRAALLYREFVKIHTFIDGNGRMVRLLFNFELMKNSYTPIIIKNKQRANYYEVLDLAHTPMNYAPFIRLVSELVFESKKLWLSVLD